MTKLKIRLLYIGFTLFWIVFFIIALFPMEKMGHYVKHYANTIHPDVKISFDTLALKLPSGLQFDAVKINYKNDDFLRAKRVKLVYRLLSLFYRGDTFYFDSRLLDGTLDGKIDLAINKDAQDISVSAHMEQLHIEKLPAVQSLNFCQLSGALSGRVTFKRAINKKQRDDSMEGTLELADASVTPMEAPLNALDDAIQFDKIDATFVKEKSRIHIKSCKLHGKQINATISGEITLNRVLPASKLNLSIEMTLDPLFMDKLKKIQTIGFFLRGKRNGRIALALGGTLERPLPLPK